MRIRIRALIAVVGVAAVARDRGPARVRGRKATRSRSTRTRRPRSAPPSWPTARSIDDCQKAPSPLLPADERDHLGLARVPRAARSRCGSSAYPPCRNMEQAREDRIRNDLEGAENGADRGRGREGAVPAQIADAQNEAGRIIEEARQAAESVRARPRSPGPSRRRTTSASALRPTSRTSGRRPWRSCAPTWPRCRSTSPAGSSSATSTTTPTASSSTASSTRWRE